MKRMPATAVSAPDREFALTRPRGLGATSRPHWLRGGSDTWMDFSIRFKSPQGEQLSKALVEEVDSRQSRQRARRVGDHARLCRTVEMVVANVFWEHFYRTSDGISLFRKKDAYPLSLRPSWLTPGALLTAVDQLAELGYLRSEKGSWGLFPGSGDASRIVLRPPLLWQLAKHEICLRSLSVDPEGVPLIRLRDAAGRPVPFDPGDETPRAFEKILSAYNASVCEHSLCLNATTREIERQLTEEMKVRAHSEDGNRLSCRPEFFRTLLYRVFNGDWHSGGRFYGGWWQSIPRHWRRRVLIDDAPTVELDFAGFSVRALYHLEGLSYDGDPYVIEQFGKCGSATVYRPHVKIITQALLNGAPGSYPERAPLYRKPKLPKGLTRRKIREWIEIKHKPISHHFCAGSGLRLQALDATVAEMVMKKGLDAGVLVLPVHDSFIASAQHRCWLESAMRESYEAVIGGNPVIH